MSARIYRLAALNALLGLVLLLGSPARTSSPSFMAARDLMDIRLFGLLALTIAVLMAATARAGRWRSTPLLLGAGFHAFWAILFALSALDTPNAALTGPIVYAFLSVVHLLLATESEPV